MFLPLVAVGFMFGDRFDQMALHGFTPEQTIQIVGGVGEEWTGSTATKDSRGRNKHCRERSKCSTER